MRLIDADKLLEETIKDRDYAEKNGFLDMYYERQVLIDRIKSQPTAYDVAINALEKQITKKPIFDFNSSDTSSKFHCTCGKIIWVHHDIGTMDNNDAPNYCSNCGLKFDWNK